MLMLKPNFLCKGSEKSAITPSGLCSLHRLGKPGVLGESAELRLLPGLRGTIPGFIFGLQQHKLLIVALCVASTPHYAGFFLTPSILLSWKLLCRTKHLSLNLNGLCLFFSVPQMLTTVVCGRCWFFFGLKCDDSAATL